MAAKFVYVRSMLNARGSVADHIDQLNLSKAKFLLFGSEFLEQADEIRRNVPSITSMICVGSGNSSVAEYEEQLADADAAEPSQAVSESDWHSIYFTSGSTGRPKGIVLSQG